MPDPTNTTPPVAAQRTRLGSRAPIARSPAEDGQALVEFALVLPIVLVILFGVVLFGIAMNDWIDETQLASEAARFAAVNSEHGEPGELKQAAFLAWVRKQGDNAEVEGAKAELCSPNSAAEGYVRVKLTVQHEWFGLTGLLGTHAVTPIVSTATMRIENPPSTPYPKEFEDKKANCE